MYFLPSSPLSIALAALASQLWLSGSTLALPAASASASASSVRPSSSTKASVATSSSSASAVPTAVPAAAVLAAAAATVKIPTRIQVPYNSKVHPLTPGGITVAPMSSANRQAKASPTTSYGIQYAIGGSVMTSNVNINIIYYGNWTQKQKDLTNTFVKNVGASSWYKTNLDYYYQKAKNAALVYPTKNVYLKTQVVDNYSLGKTLNGSSGPLLVQKYISSGAFVDKPNNLYFVALAKGVTHGFNDEVSLCNYYCGFHDSFTTKAGRNAPYALVANTETCPGNYNCAIQQDASPNNDPGVDGMMSVLAHELVEAVSDPYPGSNPSWYESDSGEENADLCAWTFGKLTQLASKAYYNVVLGKKNWLIQQNWDRTVGKCVSSK